MSKNPISKVKYLKIISLNLRQTWQLFFLYFFSFITVFIFSLTLRAENLQCKSFFENDSTLLPNSLNFKTLKKPHPVTNRQKYFSDLLFLLKANAPEFRQLLSKINNSLGNDIEMAQTRSFLKNVLKYEKANLESIEPLENAVIYGSTNVPLYTLVAQVFHVASFAKNVYVRTPAATREIYVQLFKLFADYLPLEVTKHIHLITDPSEVSYDQFNRVYVMGQNKQGTKSVRAPSELVILTGNPDTARQMIERNTRNLKKIASDYPHHKQLFLGFLAGVNPAIVVPSAKHHLDVITDKLVFPFLVNGGQDCMNSDIVFVQSGVQKELVASLKQKMSGLKLVDHSSTELGITPLTMTKSFDKLKTYREKYKKYLVTPEATINETTQQVSPHIFVIPYKEFKDLNIQEHFAPFMTLVTFSDYAQLEAASLDLRLQRKAMNALVYGGPRMSPDVFKAKDIFQRAQHSVLVNTHMYEEFEMNLPFGGAGSDTSTSVLATVHSAEHVQVETRHRPLLISREVSLAFPKNEASIDIYKVSPQPAEKPVRTLTPDLLATYRSEPTDLASLQKISSDHGIYIPYPDYSSKLPWVQDALKLYGINFINSNTLARKVKGTVLHTTDVYTITPNSTPVKGERNPLLGDEQLYKLMTQNKLEELKLVQAIDPSVMPGTFLMNEALPAEQRKALTLLQLELSQTLQSRSDHLADYQNRVQQKAYILIHTLMNYYRQAYPEGVYFKNYGEYGSGDLGNTATTFASSPKQIASEFALWASEARFKYPKKNFTSEEVQKLFRMAPYSNYVRFVNQLLVGSDKMLIQKKLNMAQTAMGSPMEFRVDFIYGQAVNARMRFGLEYYPEIQEAAMKALNEFMKKAPSQIKGLSGGADVALTKDGRFVIFEFNFGGASGTLSPEYYPFEANRIFSKLQNKKTWLLQELDRVHKLTIAEKRAFILSFKNEKPIWWKTGVQEISQIEWAKELRDLILNDWRAKGSLKATAPETYEHIKALLTDLGRDGNVDFLRLMEASSIYLQQTQK